MKYVVKILSSAFADADQIVDWIARQSPQGASRWYVAFRQAADALADDPERHALASEMLDFPELAREVSFKTQHGRRYRLLFVVVDIEVRVLRVRTPGQPPVTRDDVSRQF